jgi:hypothetical protein
VFNGARIISLYLPQVKDFRSLDPLYPGFAQPALDIEIRRK